MNEDYGSSISMFVEKRVDGPQSEENIDIWCEAVYAFLFNIAFEITTISFGYIESREDYERKIKVTLKTTCEHAAKWVNARLSKYGQSIGISYKVDMKSEMHNRIVQYFDVAYKAMSERNYSHLFPVLTFARSHASFVILQAVIGQLILCGSITSTEAINFTENIIEGCEAMVLELRDALDRNLRKTKQ